MLYWLGISFELLSACLVAEVCQASSVYLIRKEPLSMILELSKSMRWSNDHACFAMYQQPQILLKIRNISNYSSFPPQIADKLIEAGRSEEILQVKGLYTDGLNNKEDTTIQYIE